jgi:hypothetical protein
MHPGSFEIKSIYQLFLSSLSTRSVVGNNELFVCHTYTYTFSRLHHLKKMLLEFHHLFIGFPQQLYFSSLVITIIDFRIRPF